MACTPEKGKQSRRESLEAQGSYLVEMPEVPGGEYLIEYLWDMGPVKSSGMGSVPLDEVDILAWQINTGDWLQPWETRMLRFMSRELAAMLNAGTGREMPPPYSPTPPEMVRASVPDRFDQWAKARRKNGPVQHRRKG